MRMRFKKDEREAFVLGTKIEWRNGRHWHPGTVVGPIVRSNDGWDSVHITNHADTRTVHRGQRIDASPTYIRLPQEPARTEPYTCPCGVVFRTYASTQCANCGRPVPGLEKQEN